MKRILITGKNSYVGNSFEKWLGNYPNHYEVKKVSLRDGLWKKYDFTQYDVVLHVAGIAHRKETKENEQLYYKVNRDLAYEVAKKAKSEGIPHFIFLSSMSVYGMDEGVIYQNTRPNPNSNYGKSKLEAEELIDSLKDESFSIATLRPPMIYGRECKGNYPRLANIALKAPMFPNVKNRRSMIYVDNLSELIKVIIEFKLNGLYCPQNEEYINTSNLVWQIAQIHGRNVRLTKLFNPFIKYINHSIINKVFGDLMYDQNFSKIDKNYNVVDFVKSIHLTESMENR